MSPSAGCTHDMLLVDSDAQMVTALEPFVRAGTAAGDLVILQGTGQQLDLLRRAFGYGSGVRVEPAPDPFLGPMPTIAHYQRICERANAAGRAVRASGPTPALLEATDRSRWLEYEALLSRGVAPYRFTGLCRYDTRTAPREAVAAALRTHQHLVTPRGRWPLPTPSAPTRPPAADDATASSPIVIDDPDCRAAADARHALRRAFEAHAVAGEAAEAFVGAVSEVVSNALQHGRPPVHLQVHADGRRWTCVVTDHGPGMHDRWTGVDPPFTDRATAGLWVARQLCPDLAISRHGEGARVSLVALL